MDFVHALRGWLKPVWFLSLFGFVNQKPFWGEGLRGTPRCFFGSGEPPWWRDGLKGQGSREKIFLVARCTDLWLVVLLFVVGFRLVVCGFCLDCFVVGLAFVVCSVVWFGYWSARQIAYGHTGFGRG